MNLDKIYVKNKIPIKLKELAPNTFPLQISNPIPPINQKGKLNNKDSSANKITKNIKIKSGRMYTFKFGNKAKDINIANKNKLILYMYLIIINLVYHIFFFFSTN